MLSQKSGRDQDLDALKGIAIVLVVAGHAVHNLLVSQLIFSFHVPLFMFASGLTMSLSRSTLASRARNLLLPRYAWIALFWAFSGVAVWSVLGRRMLAATLNPRGGLWFLYTLFFLSVVLLILERLPVDTRRLALAVGIVALLVPHLGGIEPYSAQHLQPLTDPRGWADFNVGPGILGWRNVLWLLPFFLAGYVVGPARWKSIARNPLVFVGAALCFGVLFVLIYPPIPPEGAALPSLLGAMSGQVYVWVRYAIAFAGIALTAGACIWLGRVLVLERTLAALGAAALGIYVLHGRFLAWTAGPGYLSVAVTIVLATALPFALTDLLGWARPWATILLGKRWPNGLTPSHILIQVVFGAVAIGYLGFVNGIGTFQSKAVFVTSVAALLAAKYLWQRRAVPPDPSPSPAGEGFETDH